MTAAHPAYRTVGVDPGKHTGVAGVALYRAEKITHPILGLWSVVLEYSHTVEFEDAPPYLDAAVIKVVEDTYPGMLRPSIVVEKFVATQKTVRTQEMYSVEVTGMVRSSIDAFAEQIVFKQFKPSETKVLLKDKVLRAFGMPLAGTSMHERDAMRQAVRECVEAIQRGYVSNKKGIT